MTKHKMVTFQLHSKGVILVVVMAIVLAVLLVAAGYLAGSARAKKAAAVAAAKAARPKTPPAAPRVAAPPAGDALTLRVGLATTEAEAQEMVKALAARQLSATVVPVQTRDSLILYELHSGRYPTRAAAAAAAASLEKDAGIDAAVVPAAQPRS
jgi:hypothetical protein